MSIVDTSTQEAFDARYLAVKKAKTDLKAAIDASGAQAKVTGWKADRFTLSVQNVLPPGDNNKHGQGFSLDIKGNNARISETSKSLGATTTYDEKFHVHVEFKSGVSAPPGKPAPAAAPVQKKASGDAAGADVHQAAELGTSGSAGPLPHLDPIQRSFGKHDVSSVRAYTDGNAARGAGAMGAEAFATGDQVAFAGAPTLHTAAHEAAHVVQQRAGVALKGGVGQAGDAYERHADAVADQVVRGESAESLLDEMAGAGGGASTRAIQKNDKENPQAAAEPQGQGARTQPTGKEMAKGHMAAFMGSLDAQLVANLKDQDNALLQILLTTFEANWFKAKECLLFDQWPVEKPAPDRPRHEDCLALMDELVKMRSRVCKKFADKTQERMKGELTKTADALGPASQSPIATSGLTDAFRAEVGNEQLDTAAHFSPMAPTGAEKKTSDIDVASGGKNTEIGVRVFNETFRAELGVEFDPATVFDYNVYAADWIFPGNFVNTGTHTGPNKGKNNAVETIATHVEVRGEQVVSKDAGLEGPAAAQTDAAVERGRNEVLDEAALLHVRRNCTVEEWLAYTRTRVAGVPQGEKAALVDKLGRVDRKFGEFLEEIEDKEDELGEKIDVASEAAQSAWDSDDHLKEALETRAKNALYQERLLRVKVARLKYQQLKDKAQKTPQDVEQMATLARQVTEALTDAVFFANEVYATEGATLHATQGIQRVQKAKANFGVDIEVALTPAMYMQSFHENVGDSLHSLEHYKHDPQYAVYRAGKYIERMIVAAAALAKTPQTLAVLEGHPRYEMLRKIGEDAAKVKATDDGDDPVRIKELYAEYDAGSLGPLRQAVLSLGADFPGQLAAAERAPQGPAPREGAAQVV
ncbi:MAG: DUF4157 domain-containing protein, partial [Deltaproteobacteria bacterium]|nr:DUF4157 domain-containing protein [Kofleriaceae bacterium]